MTYLYNFSAANLAHWNSARAAVKAGTSNAKVFCVGDSTTAGFGASGSSDGWTGSRVACHPTWMSWFLNKFYAPSESDSICGIAGVPWATVGYAAYDPRLQIGSGWGTSTLSNSAGGLMFSSQGYTGVLGFASGNTADTCEILAYVAGAGFSVNADGGAALLTVPAQTGIVKVSATTTRGIHVFNIVPTSGGTVYVISVHAYDSTARKVAVINAGFGGAKAADWADNSQVWSPTPIIQAENPDLSIVNIGINDWNTSTSVTDYAASMQAIVTACASGGGNVVLHAPYPSNPAVAGYASIARQLQFIDVLYSLADKNGCGLIDLTERRGSYAESNPNGFYAGDSEHPSGAGYFDIACITASAICPT